MMKKQISLLIFFTLVLGSLTAQEVVVFGLVMDSESRAPIDFATVYVKGSSNATDTNFSGEYRLVVEPGENFTVVCSRIGYHETEYLIRAMKLGQKRNLNFKLASEETDLDIVIRESRIEDVGMVKEEVTELKKLPTTTGNFESVLPHIALGTTTGTGGELSSQYNVRGGNYDENLVYVNDFEIFRPQLIRSGQQEGLTFPNIDLIRDLSFSSGGFEAKYGDKMSSVLDIRYKRPDEFKASTGISLLGVSAHVEGSKRLGANSYNKFRYLIGARYKTTSYLLGSLDTKGEYTPDYTDIQGYFTYDLTRDLQLGLIGNYNNSNYNFIPESRTTASGLIDFALQLTSVFEGQEVDRFRNGMTGLSLTYLPERESNPLYLKLLASTFLSEEAETFDIRGFYRLAQIETDFGSDEFGQEIALLGTGTQHTYARNFLYNQVTNVEHKGGLELILGDEESNSHFLQWSAKWQNEIIDDELNEWERLDSAGYSLPFSDEDVLIQNSIKSINDLSSNRISAYFQDTYNTRSENRELRITGGVRASYWDLNEEFIVSPRMQFLYKPLKSKRELSYKLAAGIYFQPPFYRELRRPDGSLNLDLKSQRSIHIVAGMTFDFLWDNVSKKPFRLITELYYKKLDNLVSYEVDNVRIRYSGENDASGTVMGIDLRINGEFVPGAESWVNLSFLRARENITDIEHLQREVGDSIASPVNSVPRPTDRLFNINMFFQDYLPSNKNFKMHLNLSVGGGLPFGVKDNNRIFRNTFRYRPYHRVDIGFSYQLWDESRASKSHRHPLRFSKSTWLSLEVFNLLGVANVASNTWIKTITNTQYAIPNFLTSRRINLRLKMDF